MTSQRKRKRWRKRSLRVARQAARTADMPIHCSPLDESLRRGIQLLRVTRATLERSP